MNHCKLKAGEIAGTYDITAPITEAELVSIAQAFARRRLTRGRKLTRPDLVFDYLQVLFQGYEHEVFSALFLDTQHRLIHFETLFRGTIDSASVSPREVVKRALAHNAAAVILVHYVPRHIMNFLCPVSLCARRRNRCTLPEVLTRIRPHNGRPGAT